MLTERAAAVLGRVAHMHERAGQRAYWKITCVERPAWAWFRAQEQSLYCARILQHSAHLLSEATETLRAPRTCVPRDKSRLRPLHWTHRRRPGRRMRRQYRPRASLCVTRACASSRVLHAQTCSSARSSAYTPRARVFESSPTQLNLGAGLGPLGAPWPPPTCEPLLRPRAAACTA